MKKLLWSPSEEQKKSSVIWAFLNLVNERTGAEMTTYEELYKWSVDQPVQFWEAV